MRLFLREGWSSAQIEVVTGLNASQQRTLAEAGTQRLEWLRRKVGEYRSRGAEQARATKQDVDQVVREAEVQVIKAFQIEFGARPTPDELALVGIA